MTLDEALYAANGEKYIARGKWIKEGSSMRLFSAAKRIEDFYNLELSHESFFAHDWEIVE
jgi:hypothetical protein